MKFLTNNIYVLQLEDTRLTSTHMLDTSIFTFIEYYVVVQKTSPPDTSLTPRNDHVLPNSYTNLEKKYLHLEPQTLCIQSKHTNHLTNCLSIY